MRFLVMLAGFAAVLGVATPAQADPGSSGTDASFLAALNKAGITYQDPAVAVAVAKKACALMDQGNPEAGVIKSVSSSNPRAFRSHRRAAIGRSTAAHRFGRFSRRPP